jgi:hypothetical protein
MGFPFVAQIAERAFFAAWSDMGTNGLGWFVAIGSPILIAVKNACAAPKGGRFEFIRKRWKTEIRDTLFFAVGALLIIAIWEATWNIPHKIIHEADSIVVPFRVWPLPFPDVTDARTKSPERHQSHIPPPTPSPTDSPAQVSAELINPEDLAIVIHNDASKVVEHVNWELVAYRASDSVFFSYVVRSIDYVKSHMIAAPENLDLDRTQ